MSKWKFILDNGHGKETPGKRSPILPDGSQILEYEYARRIVRELHARLRASGVDSVILVPEEYDVKLSERAARANKIAMECDCNVLLISVHLNAARKAQKAALGWEVHTYLGQSRSDKLADYFWEEAAKFFNKATCCLDTLPTNMRGDYEDGDKDRDSNLYILRKTICPAILTENLFMNSEEDCKILQSERGFNAIVSAHYNAIMRIIKTEK